MYKTTIESYGLSRQVTFNRREPNKIMEAASHNALMKTWPIILIVLDSLYIRDDIFQDICLKMNTQWRTRKWHWCKFSKLSLRVHIVAYGFQNLCLVSILKWYLFIPSNVATWRPRSGQKRLKHEEMMLKIIRLQLLPHPSWASELMEWCRCWSDITSKHM